MSHRVTVQSEMKEREFVLAALRQKKVDFKESGNIIALQGDYNGASINLTNGMITSGDVDRYQNTDAGKLGLLRQAYAEEKAKAVLFKEGHALNERVVEKNGDVVLFCRMA